MTINLEQIMPLTLEIAQRCEAVAGEAIRANPSRAYLEADAARLLKTAARLYAALCLPGPLSVVEAALRHLPANDRGDPHAA